jgi:drug/metabolite transporter (DMT)-like permease
MLVGAQLAIGAAAIFARYALHGTGAIEASALRLTIAAFPVFFAGVLLHRKVSVTRPHEIRFFVAGLSLAVHFATWIGSLEYISVAVSTLLVSTAPVWCSLYDVFVLKKKLSGRFWGALFAGAIGMFIIVCSNSSAIRGGAAVVTASPTQSEAIGTFLALSGGLAFGVYLILMRAVVHSYPTLLVVGRSYVWAAVVLWTAALLHHESPPGADWTSWGGIIGMALFSQMLGHTGINASLRFFSTRVVAFSTLLEPIFAALLAAMLLAEKLESKTIIGSLIVLVALAVVLREQSDDEAPTESI